MESNVVYLLIWSLVLVVLFWCMPNHKVRLIFGETRKLGQILPLTKIAEAIIAYLKRKGKENHDKEEK